GGPRAGPAAGPPAPAGRLWSGARRVGPGRARGSPLVLGRTQYAGAFLLLGHALDWLNVAQECFRDSLGGLTRGLLTSVFALVVGLERVFHLDQMEDLGFALLSGGRRCPRRHAVGGWARPLGVDGGW